MPPRESLSLAQARRVALAAQGFADPQPAGAPSGWAVRRLFDRVGLVQIDSVNVLSRAHYLPLFSRVGPYDRALMDRGAHYAPRKLFEYWGHEASLIPVALQPLLRWRMERAHEDAWGGMRRIQRERPELVADVLAEVRERGPVAASELAVEEKPKRTGPWWDWSDVKRAIEFLFWSGQVTSARRRGFERLYDVPERVLPAEVIEHADAVARGGPARAAQGRRAVDGRGERARPARLLPAPDGRGEGADRRARGGGRPAARSRSRAGATTPTSTPARASRGGSTRARCSARSTR